MDILVVDDDDSVLELLTEILTLEGYHTVETASNAKAALDLISDPDRDFDCFVVDIQMPEVDGISLVSMIRETPDYRDSPILMLTAMDEKAYLDRAFAAGATDYVTKPFDLLELRNRIIAARRLVYENSQAAAQPWMAAQFSQEREGPKGFRLAQPIPLKSRDVALGYQEFENYVLELARNCDLDATFRAVKIADVERHYRQSSSRDFARMIDEAASTIRNVMTSDQVAFSYRGNGAFVCLCEPPMMDASSYLEDVFAQQIDRMSTDAGIPAFRMIVGEPVGVDSSSDSVVLKNMSDAVESVEQKSFEARDIASMTKRLLSRRPTTEVQQRLEQKAYESLLKKLLHSPSDKTWSRKLQEREDRLYRST